MTNTVTASSSSVAGLDLYAKFTITPVTDGNADKAELTDQEGYAYAIVNGYLQETNTNTADLLAKKYATVQVAFEGWYKEAACTNAADADQKARIAEDASVTVYVGGDTTNGARSRVSLTTPTDYGSTDADGSTRLFQENFGTALLNRVAITFTFNAGGTVKTGDDTNVYVAISGEESLKTRSQMSALVGSSSGFKSDASSSFTQTLKVYDAAE